MCKHEKVQFEGMFSMIGSYVCTKCKMKIEPFVYNKMTGRDHILFTEKYKEKLQEAISQLDQENYKLWQEKETN